MTLFLHFHAACQGDTFCAIVIYNKKVEQKTGTEKLTKN
jgi:hypothetical protein